MAKAELNSLYQWWLKKYNEDSDHSRAQFLNPVHLIYLLEREQMLGEANKILELIAPSINSYLSFVGTDNIMKSPSFWVAQLQPFCQSDSRLNSVVEQLKQAHE
jgi:hypothetical protein